MSYEDSFEREAADQREYDGEERVYIFKNMRPANIGIWEWRLMFDQLVLHDSIVDAMRDAKVMALELQRSAVVKYSTFYSAEPDDYWDGKLLGGNRYEKRQWHFLKLLVIHGKFPIGEITGGRRYGASRHYINEVGHRHKMWKQAYTALSDSEKLDFDRGPCQRPFPEGFWTSETYQAAPDAITAIEMTRRKSE